MRLEKRVKEVISEAKAIVNIGDLKEFMDKWESNVEFTRAILVKIYDDMKREMKPNGDLYR